MSLREYKRKRDFRKTDEPAGDNRPKAGSLFVVQKHAATRLHYDFRLEHEGVLKSWAVPHGPSLDPTVKSLAVQVEDHPIDYAAFEGTIPKGEYGGGTVMVWDNGTWEPEDANVSLALKRGKLSFRLHGTKLAGSWTLVQMRSHGLQNWLLLKKRDEFAVARKQRDVLEDSPRSVLTGRDLSQIADGEKPVRRKKTSKVNQEHVTTGSNPSPSSTVTVPRSDRADKKYNRSAHRARHASVLKLLRDAPTGPLPKTVKPQLATLTDAMPDGDLWVHEIKLDGYRILARRASGNVQLMTRSGLDWTERFPTIAGAIVDLNVDNCWLDGEIVALDQDGVSSFQKLQNCLSRDDDGQLVYYVFDLPWAEGKDLTGLPLIERKRVLAQILTVESDHSQSTDATAGIGPLRYHDHISGSGKSVLKNACQLALEGLVSKRSDSRYDSQRSVTWLKIKCVHNQEFVVCGYTRPAGRRVGFGALLLGYYANRKLIYCGRVGTGFSEASLKELLARFEKLETDGCPYDQPPTRAQQRGVHWLKPVLVAEISYATRTADGILRQSVFQGLREDKPARQVVLEQPVMVPKGDVAQHRTRAASEAATSDNRPTARSARTKPRESMSTIAGVEITHPQRMIYDQLQITKVDLAEYFEQVGKWILPGLVGRPVSLLRCPAGTQRHCFYQKHLDEELPPGVHGVSIREKNQTTEYPVIDDLPGLIALAQRNTIEFHPWPALADDIEHPDRLVFDLDPGPDCAWDWVIEAAHAVRDTLEQVKLVSFARTSGGKGVHVVVPLRQGCCSWDQLKSFAMLLAQTLAEQNPKRYVATIKKSARRGKVFIDYLRNQRGATAIASYSPRARASAGVAMPIAWNQLKSDLSGDHYTIRDAIAHLRRRRVDPWRDFFSLQQNLPVS